MHEPPLHLRRISEQSRAWLSAAAMHKAIHPPIRIPVVHANMKSPDVAIMNPSRRQLGGRYKSPEP